MYGSKDPVIEIDGIVTESLSDNQFTVDIGDGHSITASVSSKLRMNFTKILPGTKVTVQISPYDLSRGKITWRHAK